VGQQFWEHVFRPSPIAPIRSPTGSPTTTIATGRTPPTHHVLVWRPASTLPIVACLRPVPCPSPPQLVPSPSPRQVSKPPLAVLPTARHPCLCRLAAIILHGLAMAKHAPRPALGPGRRRGPSLPPS